MLNKKSLLFLISTITFADASKINVHALQEIAMDATKGLPIRLSNADTLLDNGYCEAAAAAYKSILSDERCKKDLEWQFLAAEGLVECGGAHQERALLTMFMITNSKDASDELKANVTELLTRMQLK